MPVAVDWKPLEAADMPQVLAIAARLHPELPERLEVLAEKRRLFPDGCRKLMAGLDMAGYGLAHPWRLNAAPRVDAFLELLPSAPDCLYLHDVAVLSEGRGRGAAGAYVVYLEGLARKLGLGHLALVSVYGTVPLWEKLGFKSVSAGAPPLPSYGPSAAYMAKKL
ncbi:MAG: GNAT family N-acetyltransferase [Elusimicrobiales bacterium]|nr:GNAT family N-acetyltransferase [Elusimicrobiales bacterium]